MLSFFRKCLAGPITTPEQRHSTELPTPVGDHPLWKDDGKAAGTSPESVQTGTLRQVTRVIGRHLAETTPSRTEAVQAVAQVVSQGTKLANLDPLLYGVVEKVTTSANFTNATNRLHNHLQATMQGLSPSERLTVLVGLCRGAFDKMIDCQLSKPQNGFQRVNGDRTMHTVFGVRGEVVSLDLQLLQGKLAGSLLRELSAHSRKYQAEKARLPSSRALHDDTGFHVTLHVGKKVREDFKVTANGFREAYFTALMEYASVTYADRERRAQASTPNPPLPNLHD